MPWLFSSDSLEAKARGWYRTEGDAASLRCIYVNLILLSAMASYPALPICALWDSNPQPDVLETPAQPLSLGRISNSIGEGPFRFKRKEHNEISLPGLSF